MRLEPLDTHHAERLWAASRDPKTWQWLSIVQPATRDAFDEYLTAAVDAAHAGTEIPLVTISHERGVAGSTRFLALRPEHGSVEIGWTWIHPSAWGTGVNIEAKLLMLRHAFEVWGCRRVEPRPTRRTHAHAVRWRRWARASREFTASTCSSATARTATAPGTRSWTTSGPRFEADRAWRGTSRTPAPADRLPFRLPGIREELEPRK